MGKTRTMIQVFKNEFYTYLHIFTHIETCIFSVTVTCKCSCKCFWSLKTRTREWVLYTHLHKFETCDTVSC